MPQVEVRTYDVDFGDREHPEDTTRCVEAVPNHNSWFFPQCSRKRGFGKDGLYCKQHAKRHPTDL